MNLKQNIIGIAIAAVAFGGILLIAKPTTSGGNASNASSAGTINLEETSFDFGSISMAAGKVSHVFKIKNSGTEPALIGKLYTSCMCTSAELDKGGKKFGPYGMPGHNFIPTIGEELAPGEEANIVVTFDPAAHGPAGVGTIKRVVYLESGSAKPLELLFSAVVTP